MLRYSSHHAHARGWIKYYYLQVSFHMSEYTADVDGIGALRLLNAIRSCGLEHKCKLYQASTSELYGKVQEIPQSETTPFYPRSPYGRYITYIRHTSYAYFCENKRGITQ